MFFWTNAFCPHSYEALRQQTFSLQTTAAATAAAVKDADEDECDICHSVIIYLAIAYLRSAETRIRSTLEPQDELPAFRWPSENSTAVSQDLYVNTVEPDTTTLITTTTTTTTNNK